MVRNYIGLANSFHDSALAIVNSQGEVTFAEATERSLQSKRALCIAPDVVHYAGDVIRQYCEPGAEIVSAFSWSDAPTESSVTQLLRTFEGRRSDLEKQYGDIPEALKVELIGMRHAAVSMWKGRVFPGCNLDFELGRIGWERPFVADRRRFDHHLTHAAAACLSSPFGEATCAVVDGVGENAACAFYRYRDGVLTPINGNARSAGSLGFFYLKVCLAAGFGILTGEEWKVMGLAAFGAAEPNLCDWFRRMICVNGLVLEAPDGDSERLSIYELRRAALGSRDIAAQVARAGQQVFTETLLELLRNAYEIGDSRNLVLSGGCALNSSASGAILENTPFESLYTFCAPGDDGNAVGAALLAFQQDSPVYKPKRVIQSPYLGSCMSTETLERVRRGIRATALTECGEGAPRRAAELIADGKIIGWVRGRAEFGPRALGNRSILADPRRSDIKERINARIKFREDFRPLAPAILHDYGTVFFAQYQESPYMERTLKFRPEMVHLVPGVVHVDGTGRLQTVKKEWNPDFHTLIEEFRGLTGIPLVLNTSLNVMGRPIAHSVEDVLAVFYSSGLDAVFIDGLMIEK